MFKVQQITNSREIFNIFLTRAGTKIPLIIHKNTPFEVKKITFSGKESPQTSAGGEG